jgi:hypothetical protein
MPSHVISLIPLSNFHHRFFHLPSPTWILQYERYCCFIYNMIDHIMFRSSFFFVIHFFYCLACFSFFMAMNSKIGTPYFFTPHQCCLDLERKKTSIYSSSKKPCSATVTGVGRGWDHLGHRCMNPYELTI